jgi:hypothetical protein
LSHIAVCRAAACDKDILLMLDTISVYGTRALDLLGLVPNWLVGTVILGIAVALALLAFRMVVAAVRRAGASGERHL